MEDRKLANNERIIEADFKVTYNTESPPSIADVVKSLNSLEYLIKKGTLILDAAYENIEVIRTEVYVQDVEAGSLFEWLKVKCLTRAIGEDNLERLEEVFDDIIQDNEKVNNLIMLGTGAFIGAGIVAGSALLSKDEVQPINNYNTVNIVNVAKDAGLSGEQIENIVATNMSKKVAEKAIAFVQPAKDEAASISIGDNQQLTIPSEVVKNTPTISNLEPPETKEEDYSNVDLYVYASDQDSSSRGWAGIAPDLFEKRVKFELDGAIDPFKLHSAGKKIKADITLIRKYDKDKKVYVPEKIIIHNTNITT